MRTLATDTSSNAQPIDGRATQDTNYDGQHDQQQDRRMIRTTIKMDNRSELKVQGVTTSSQGNIQLEVRTNTCAMSLLNKHTKMQSSYRQNRTPIYTIMMKAGMRMEAVMIDKGSAVTLCTKRISLFSLLGL